jgi:hypothetical protein
MTLEIVDGECLERKLQSFVAGGTSWTELQGWFAAILVGERVEIAEADAPLVSRVLYMFEDPPVGEDQLASMARDILWIMREVSPWQSQGDLLEMRWVVDRFHELVRRRLEGKVSTTGWSNALLKMRFSPPFKRRLELMDRHALEELDDELNADSIEAVSKLVRR